MSVLLLVMEYGKGVFMRAGVIKVFVLTVLFLLSFFVHADKKNSSGLKKGDSIRDFGMRKVDVKTGKLKSMVWVSDFVGEKAKKAEKKELLIINFYANWCEPCLKEMDILKRFYEKYKEKGVQVLSINFRTSDEKFKPTLKKSVEIIKEKDISYPVLFDRFTNRNQLVYMGQKATLPALFFVDSSGVIVEKFQGSELDGKIIKKVIEKYIDNK